MSKPSDHDTYADEPQFDSFDVTCVVGTVMLDGSGEDPPHVAAFKLIALHDTPGEYVFPLAPGGKCRVTVAYENERG